MGFKRHTLAQLWEEDSSGVQVQVQVQFGFSFFRRCTMFSTRMAGGQQGNTRTAHGTTAAKRLKGQQRRQARKWWHGLFDPAKAFRSHERHCLALEFIGNFLRKPRIHQHIASVLDIAAEQVRSLDDLWAAAKAEAARAPITATQTYLDRRCQVGFEEGHHPLLRHVKSTSETPVSFVLRFIAGISEVRLTMAALRWELPDPGAPSVEFVDYFDRLCEAAAGEVDAVASA